MAILLGSGSFNTSAVQLAKEILSSASNNLNDLGKKDLNDFLEFNGIGEAKAITIIAAMELGRRRQASDILLRPKITGSKDAFQILKPLFQDLPHEEFHVLFLNRSNTVIKRIKVGLGGVSGVYVDIKIILNEAVKVLCSSLILAHNHPSGNLKPSKQDIEITQKITKAASYLDIAVLDHIIIGEHDYYSFKDSGIH